MILFPAIDLYEGMAVRLLRGDYRNMTVYDRDPAAVARRFQDMGASCLHMVDLEGAKTGRPEQLPLVARIVRETGLFVEVGGGIRTLEDIARYREAGVGRVILGTAAVSEPGFAEAAVRRFGPLVAAGVDIKNGRAAVRGWQDTAGGRDECLTELWNAGIRTVICTDIARDGAMEGANHALYEELREKYAFRLIASGGVSSLLEVHDLARMGLYGAIIGKAYYSGAIDLKEALQAVKEETL